MAEDDEIRRQLIEELRQEIERTGRYSYDQKEKFRERLKAVNEIHWEAKTKLFGPVARHAFAIIEEEYAVREQFRRTGSKAEYRIPESSFYGSGKDLWSLRRYLAEFEWWKDPGLKAWHLEAFGIKEYRHHAIETVSRIEWWKDPDFTKAMKEAVKSPDGAKIFRTIFTNGTQYYYRKDFLEVPELRELIQEAARDTSHPHHAFVMKSLLEMSSMGTMRDCRDDIRRLSGR